MKKGSFFLLDITGLIVTFKANQVVLGSPYLYALENSGSLLVQRLPRNGNASGDEAVSRAVPNGVDLFQAHWKLGIMTWRTVIILGPCLRSCSPTRVPEPKPV